MSVVRLFQNWIAGLRSRIACAPHAPGREAGMLALQYFNAELEEIGKRVEVWRLQREDDRNFAFRIATEIASKLNALEHDLDRVIHLNKR